MLLSDYYSTSKHSLNGNSYEILSYGKNQRSVFLLKCIVCGEEVSIRPASVLSGRKPCSCNNLASSPEKKIKRLLPILKQKNLKLLSVEIQRAKDPIQIECLVCNNTWSGSYNGLVLKGTGCKFCANNVRPTEAQFQEQIEKLGRSLDFSFISMEYSTDLKLRKVPIKLNCLKCKKSWITTSASIRKGSTCPQCAYSGFNPLKPAKLYILKVISSDNILQGYKYGITCDIERRLYEHHRDCKSLGLKFEVSYIWQYENGDLAQFHERLIKSKFESYFNLQELPSGFTESIPIYSLSELVDFQSQQYRKELWLD